MLQIADHQSKIIRNQQGMTLLEIMIVLVILGGLVTILATQVTGRLKKARVEEAKIQISEVSKALNLYYTDCGFYPSEEQGLEALVEPPTSEPQCASWGPDSYLKKTPKDPWGSPFIYENSGSSFILISLGEDRREGGSKFDADISSEDI